MDINDDPAEPTGPVEDDRLRLLFTCCHPALAPENRVALTLRLLGGLTVAEIAAAFFVPETTMAQRITRSKQKIRVANIPYRIPRAEDVPERMSGVLAVLYLVFNEGYLGSSGEALRTDLTTEAIRLTRQLREMLAATPSLGRQPEVDGLLALMLLVDSRREARVRDGVLVALDEQDRTLWDATMIDEGHQLVRRCLSREPAGALPAAGCDQRRAHRCARRIDDRLDPGAAALRPAARDDTQPGGGAEPGGRRGRGRRARGGAGAGRAAAAGELPRVARDPGRPAPATRSRGRGAHGVRPGDRPGGQRRRAGVPAHSARASCPGGLASPARPSPPRCTSSGTPRWR